MASNSASDQPGAAVAPLCIAKVASTKPPSHLPSSMEQLDQLMISVRPYVIRAMESGTPRLVRAAECRCCRCRSTRLLLLVAACALLSVESKKPRTAAEWNEISKKSEEKMFEVRGY